MNNNNQKLELTWVGKYDEQKALEPRILLENPDYHYGKYPSSLDPNEAGNLLIHGDNLLALRALIAAGYGGMVKCIYIDPPYNTGAAFDHYDDNKEHSIWLSLMKRRLELLRDLLSPDGSIWISIDAYECHYLKVLCDEVFGRANFIDEVIWQRSYAPINLKKTVSRSHDAILIYAKNSDGFNLNKLPRSAEANSRYKNPDDDPRGPWTSGPIQVGPRVESRVYPITTPSGKVVMPPSEFCWRYSKDRLDELIEDNRIYFGPEGNNVPRIKRFLSEVNDGVVAMTLWLRDEVGDNQEAKKEVKAINGEDVFSTPKPERLMQRILTLASDKGDLVLDSFLGSGTTTAVAHKMGRRWIGIELGDHAYTHCAKRMQMVVDGSDQGGISKAENWTGGGGYRFYELAPTLLLEDSEGIEVINEKYNPNMLAAAMAIHEGFTFSPDSDAFWKQGYSSESDYIYTTTQHLTKETLSYINEMMTGEETLLICCISYTPGLDTAYDRITIKRIPQMLLGRCEFHPDRDKYNLNIISMPTMEDEDIEDIADLD